jgi:hypothetical protein
LARLVAEVAEKKRSLYTESFPEQLCLSKSIVEGSMGRLVSSLLLAYALISCLFWLGCSSGSPTNVITNQIPASVSLCASSAQSCSSGLNISLETGKFQTFTATARNVLNQAVTETFSFESSNPTVATVSNNGSVCAGIWNSLSNPTVCAPGPVGRAQITATTQGVSSPPITIYVHQHITSISVGKSPTQQPTLSNSCLSKGAPTGPESWLFEAFAFNGSTDITSTVGPFSWQTVDPPGSTSIVNLTATPTIAGGPLNQQIVTANSPGLAQIYASTSGLNSQAIPTETCRVQSIVVNAAGNPPTNTSFVVNTGTSTTLNATVTDSANQIITGVPLTWSTSNPVSVGVSGATSTSFGSVGTASAPAAGAGTVIASCTPPTCNGGIRVPSGTGTTSLPVYPESAIAFLVRNPTTTTSPTVYATSTACSTANPTNATCNPAIVSITRSSSTSSFAAGTPTALPFSPNSIVFENNGSNAYLGVDSSVLGTKGLMVFNGSAVSQFTGAPGKVLAVSPDRTITIIADTVDTPNQLFICTNCTSSSRTVTSFLVDKATAAAFSPDSSKAYVVTASKCPGTLSAGCLLVYSKVDGPKLLTLPAAEDDVTFFPEGGFAYFAESGTSTVAARHTCDDSSLPSISMAAAPVMIRALPDHATLLVLDPPFIQLINVAEPMPGDWSGCTPPVNNTVVGTFNLGQGNFTPTQLIVSPDGTAAYVLGETSPPPGQFPFIIQFNIQNQTSSLLSLANSAVPLSASLSPTGDLLFVGANDGTVHVLDTASGLDGQPVTFPFPSNELCFGPGSPPTRVPLTVVDVTGASQSASNTTFTYTPISGPPLQVGQTIVIAGMKDPGNIGTFTITALGNGTFTVTNSLGVSDTGQSGTGTVPITCNPDLVAVKP